MSFGSKQTIGYKIYCGLHMVLCHGPVDFIHRLRVDKLTIKEGNFPTGSTVNIDEPNFFGGDEQEGGIVGNIDVEGGESTQGRNDYLAGAVGQDGATYSGSDGTAVGLTYDAQGVVLPAYRGVLGLVFRKPYLGTSRYLKNWDFRVQRILVRQDGIAQWYPAKAPIVYDSSLSNGSGVSSTTVLSPTFFDYVLEGTNQMSTLGTMAYNSSNDLLYICATWSGGAAATRGPRIWAIDPTDQSVVYEESWSSSNENDISYFCVTSQYVIAEIDYGGVGAQKLVVMNHDLSLVGEITSGTMPTAPMSGSGSTVYWAGASGVYTCDVDVDTSTAQLAAYPAGYTNETGNRFAVISGSKVYASVIEDDSNQLSAIGVISGGSFTTFVRPTAELELFHSGIFDNDGHLWFGATAVVGGDNYLVKFNTTTNQIDLEYNLTSNGLTGDWGGVRGYVNLYYNGDTNKIYMTNDNVGVFDVGNETLTAYAKGTATGAWAWYDQGTDTVISGVVVSVNLDLVLIKLNSQPALADMNPAHIIRECLTDPDWGMGYPEADIDDAAFTVAADTLYDEDFGLSLVWDRQTELEEFIGLILRHIDAVLYVSKTSGKFVLKLIRQDYAPTALTILDESNIESVDKYKRTAFGELVNSVTVVYANRVTAEQDSVAVRDIALVQQQGSVIDTTVQYPGVRSHALASRLADRDLKSLSTQIKSCTVVANREAADLNIGDAFILDWPELELDTQIMRVQTISYGDGLNNRIKIGCVQDVFATAAEALIATPPDLTEDVGGDAVQAVPQAVMEAPYYVLAQAAGDAGVTDVLTQTPTAGYVMATGGKPNRQHINMEIYADPGTGYQADGFADFSPWAYTETGYDENADLIVIDSSNNLADVTVGTWGIWDDEIIRVDDVTITDSNGNTAILVGRGCLDTIPQQHASSTGTYILFAQEFRGIASEEYTDGEAVDVKLITKTLSDALSLAAATTHTVTMASRAIAPYPPGRFRINGEPFKRDYDIGETLVFEGAHRDRTQQTGATIYDTNETSIGPETNTQYYWKFYDVNNDLQVDVTQSEPSYTLTGAARSAWYKNFSNRISSTSGLLIWYRCNDENDTADTCEDGSGNGYHAEWKNEPTRQVAGGVDGDTDKAVTLNSASTQFANRDLPAAIKTSTTTFIAAIKTTSISTSTIFAAVPKGSANDSRGIGLSLKSTGAVSVRAGTGTGSFTEVTSTSTGLNNDAWHLIFGRYDGTDLSIWVDGDSENSGSFAGPIQWDDKVGGFGPDPAQLYIGGERNNSAGTDANTRLFTGTVDECVVFNTSLDDATLSKIYNSWNSATGDVDAAIRVVFGSTRDGYDSFQQYDHTLERNS